MIDPIVSGDEVPAEPIRLPKRFRLDTGEDVLKAQKWLCRSALQRRELPARVEASMRSLNLLLQTIKSVSPEDDPSFTEQRRQAAERVDGYFAARRKLMSKSCDLLVAGLRKDSEISDRAERLVRAFLRGWGDIGQPRVPVVELLRELDEEEGKVLPHQGPVERTDDPLGQYCQGPNAMEVIRGREQ